MSGWGTTIGRTGALFGAGLVEAIPALPGVTHVMGVRVSKLSLRTDRSPVVLIARPLATSADDKLRRLPLVADALPDRPGRIGIYACGPTIYGPIHIGNARTFSVFDLVARWLRANGPALRL